MFTGERFQMTDINRYKRNWRRCNCKGTGLVVQSRDLKSMHEGVEQRTRTLRPKVGVSERRGGCNVGNRVLSLPIVELRRK